MDDLTPLGNLLPVMDSQPSLPSRERFGGAEEPLIQSWLATLGLLIAGKMDAEDVQMRLMAYSRLMIDIPPSLLTDKTLRAAALQFKWFPSFSELNDFFNAQRSYQRY